jgi:uncharacterized membrane protein
VNQTQSTAVGRHLVWLVVQTLLLLPMVLGQGVLEELSAMPIGIWLLQILLAAFVGIFLVRNAVRLWRAPSAEAGAWTTIPLLSVGVLFVLLSSGPLVEGERISTKPLGLALLIIGVFLVFLGLRDALRIRSRRTAEPAL